MGDKILITGANGFIGSCLTRLLNKKNLSIITTDLAETGRIQGKKIKYIPADLLDKKSLKKVVKGVDTIFHTAALFNLSAPADLLFKVNVLGTKNLLEAAKESGVTKTVVWSSSSVYGVTKQRITRTENEQLEQFRSEDYAQSKYQQERLALSFHEPDKFSIVIIRPANVYGFGTKMGLGLAMYSVKLGLMRQKPGKEPVFTSHVHAEDVARAAYFLSTKTEADGEIFNVCEDKPVSTDELFEIGGSILEIKIMPGRLTPGIMGVSAKVAEFLGKIKKKDPLFERHGIKYMLYHHILSNEKIRKLGFRFKWNIKSALPEIIGWYQENQWQIFKT